MRILFLAVAATLTRIATIDSLRCWHCMGERIAFDQWMLGANEICRLRRTKCQSGAFSCIVAQVKGSQNFSISGCAHDDNFVGCDSHRVPLNAVVHRCQCLGNYCNVDILQDKRVDFEFPKREALDPPTSGTSPFASSYLAAFFVTAFIKWL